MDAAESNSFAPAAVSLETINLTFASTLEAVAEVERAAEELALRTGFDEDTASNIAMVSREAAINAVKHGNGFAPDKKVTATLQRTADSMLVRIADEGKGLNPDSLPDPLDPQNLLRDSGRGVFLMRALMNEVHFRQLDPGTEVTLIKHRDREAGS